MYYNISTGTNLLNSHRKNLNSVIFVNLNFIHNFRNFTSSLLDIDHYTEYLYILLYNLLFKAIRLLITQCLNVLEK